MKITAHCLVKNDENFVWFAINSVIDYVDKIFVWDTGSTDKTCEIIKSIKNNKICFEEKGSSTPEQLSFLRNDMIKKSDSDWIFILDGDEIWFEDGIKEIQRLIENNNTFDLIVSPTKMLIGDMFHYQQEFAGRYKISDKKGHYNIRAIRNFKGLHVGGLYPDEAYLDANDIKIQNFPKERIIFAKTPYLHASFLERSSQSRPGFKYELGENFPDDYYYPEIMFKPRPEIVPSPWKTRDMKYELIATFQTPLKKIKRRLI